nr:putative reverse transcriptase domain-containing protein [Tanacetum cinerariifolium]
KVRYRFDFSLARLQKGRLGFTNKIEKKGLFPQGAETTAPRDGRTGGRTGRCGGRTGEPIGRFGGRSGNQDGQGGDQGIGANGGIGEVLGFSTVIAQQLQDLLPTIIAQVGNHASNIKGDARSANVSNGRNGCLYKEFMACNPNDYDEKGGREATVGMTWEDFKGLMRKEFCLNNELQKLESEFWCHMMVGASHAAYTNQFHKLSRLVPHLVTPKNKRIERNGSLRKNTEKKGNSRDLSRDGNLRYDNKRSRTGRVFATVTYFIRKEYTGHFAKDCKAGPRMEARQDPDTMTGTFTLNNHYATTLFNSDADYSFVSTTCITLLDIEPSDLGFSYEIQIASRQLVEINKVIRGCKLEIEGYTFDIDLIPFRHGSFNVIVWMDWLSQHKAEIIFHEKVVRISLPYGEILRVLGEKPKEKVRHLISVKAEGQKLKDIDIVRNFPEVFPDDLSGSPPS